jgi:hypothetical protein
VIAAGVAGVLVYGLVLSVLEVDELTQLRNRVLARFA